MLFWKQQVVAAEEAVLEVGEVNQEQQELNREERRQQEQVVCNQQANNFYEEPEEEVVQQDRELIQEDYREEGEALYYKQAINQLEQKQEEILYNNEVDNAILQKNQEICQIEAQAEFVSNQIDAVRVEEVIIQDADAPQVLVVVNQQVLVDEVVAKQPVFQEEIVVEQPVFQEEIAVQQLILQEEIVVERPAFQEEIVVIEQPIFQEEIIVERPVFDENEFVPATEVFVDEPVISKVQELSQKQYQYERFDTVMRFSSEDIELKRQGQKNELRFGEQRLVNPVRADLIIANEQIAQNIIKQEQIDEQERFRVKTELQKINRKKQMMNVLGVEDAKLLQKERLLNERSRNIEAREYELQQQNQNAFEQIKIIRQEDNAIQIYNQIVPDQVIKQEVELQMLRIQLLQKQQQIVDLSLSNNIPMVTSTINPLVAMESQAFYHSFFQWKKGVAVIQNGIFRLPEKEIPLAELSKIKVLKETAIHDTQKLKLSHFTNNMFFSVKPETIFEKVSLHYFWFAKIVTMKLEINGYDLKNTYVPQKKFTNINVKNAFIDGIIYKQSQYLGNWELRYVAITPAGLASYKDEKSSETFAIKRGTVTEIWTRFDIHEKMLVIKVHHSKKTEFAIPLTNYCVESSINWLYPFYRLMYEN